MGALPAEEEGEPGPGVRVAWGWGERRRCPPARAAHPGPGRDHRGAVGREQRGTRDARGARLERAARPAARPPPRDAERERRAPILSSAAERRDRDAGLPARARAAESGYGQEEDRG